MHLAWTFVQHGHHSRFDSMMELMEVIHGIIACMVHVSDQSQAAQVPKGTSHFNVSTWRSQHTANTRLTIARTCISLVRRILKSSHSTRMKNASCSPAGRLNLTLLISKVTSRLEAPSLSGDQEDNQYKTKHAWMRTCSVVLIGVAALEQRRCTSLLPQLELPVTHTEQDIREEGAAL